MITRRSLVPYPSREDQHCRVATQSTGQDFGALHAQAHAVVLNGGEGGLRDARGGGQVVLAHLLQLTQYPDGLADGDLDTLFCFTILTHFIASRNRGE